MAWTFGLTDLQGTRIGQVNNAYERSLALRLNGLDTASFRVRLDNPMADAIMSREGDVLLKVYQGSALRFIGDLTTAEEVGNDRGVTLACNFAGPLWRLSKRLCGIDHLNRGVTFTDTNADLILKQLLDDANADPAGQGVGTGIRAGSFDSLYPVTAGPWYFKPVSEGITDLQKSQIPYPMNNPSILYASDEFAAAFGTPLNGTSDAFGNTWSEVGAGDFLQGVSGAGDECIHNATGTLSAINSAADRAGVVVGADWIVPSVAAVRAASTFSGVTARYVDANNNVSAYVDWAGNGGQVQVTKVVAGVSTAIGGPVFFTPELDNTGMRMRFAIDDAGNFIVWYGLAGATLAAPVVSGYDADLATGGPLETGKVAFFDTRSALGSTSDVYYDAFIASAYTGPQSFDFRFTPIEPVLQSGTWNIAQFDVVTLLGSDKTNVVFEYGEGNRAIKSYNRVLSREELANVFYCIGSGDVTTSGDGTLIATRGLFQDVATPDFPDALLRQSYGDMAVQTRKNAKQTLGFEPSASAPVFATDYAIGDTVTARVKVNGVSRLGPAGVTVRVHGLDVTIDENGKATEAPLLVPTA